MTRLLVGVALVLAGVGIAAGATLRVPEDYSTIRSAIAAASPSPAPVESVSVAAGTYYERLSIRKPIVLRGRDGADVTIIDGHSGGNVITVNNVGRNCIIEDLTLTGGHATSNDSVGTALYLNEASPTIQRCRMVGNDARIGAGLAAYVYCHPLVKNCWIANNSGGAVWIELDVPTGGSYAEFENTVVVHNGGNAFSAVDGRIWMRNCTVAFNAADGVRARGQARVRINNTVIVYNGRGGILREDPLVCFTLQCNDVFGNPFGNYLGANPQDACFPGRGAGDVSVDPCFRDAVAEDLHLVETSPLCSQRQPGGCGVVGAYGDPCSGSIRPCVYAVESPTWGILKTLYR